jgi:predicted phage terminase large subunit-like protein
VIHKVKLSDLPEKYFFADLASGKKSMAELKRVRARQAICGVAPYYFNKRRYCFVIYAWAGRLSTPEFKKKLIDIHDKWQPTRFGLEANAMQSLFTDTVIDEVKRSGERVRFVAIDQPTKIDKDWRIRTALQEPIANHEVFLLHTQTELQTEVVGFPTAATKDVIDALASIFYHLLPKKRKPEAENKDETDALAEYMRLSGATPAEIMRRLGL